MDVEATRVRSRIMYIESKVESLQGRAPIGRVTFPEAGRIRKLLCTVQKPATSEARESSSAGSAWAAC